jgi:hypothetical protein
VNDLQYGEMEDVAEALNTMPRELTDQDIKGVLINVCRRMAHLERVSSATAPRDRLGKVARRVAR